MALSQASTYLHASSIILFTLSFWSQSLGSLSTAISKPISCPKSWALHLRSTIPLAFEILIKPLHMLQKRRLLRELGTLIAHIRAHCKTMLHIRVQADLIRDIMLFENILRLPPLLLRKDLIRLRRRNTQRCNHGLHFVRLDKGRMRHTADFDAFPFGAETCYIFRAKAVPDASNLLHAHAGFHPLDDGFDDGVDLAWSVAFALWAAFLQPGHEVKAFRAVERDGIAFEEVGDDDKVAISSEVVGDAVRDRVSDLNGLEIDNSSLQLHVYELVSDDVREDEDGIGCLLVFRIGEVCRDCPNVLVIVFDCSVWSALLTVANVLELALGLALVLDTNGAAACWWVGSHLKVEVLLHSNLG